VDWNLIDEIDPKVLMVTNDTSKMKKVVKNFLNANCLFEDPSFCPIDLVYKYFQILQISVKNLCDENRHLRKLCAEQKSINKENETKYKDMVEKAKKEKPESPKQTIYQCAFCPKAFYSKEYLHKHIQKSHQEDLAKLSKEYAKEPPPEKREQEKSSTTDQSKDDILNEFKAIIDNLETNIKKDHEFNMTYFSNKFKDIEKQLDKRKNTSFTDSSFSFEKGTLNKQKSALEEDAEES
jgi:hypothetical protein